MGKPRDTFHSQLRRFLVYGDATAPLMAAHQNMSVGGAVNS